MKYAFTATPSVFDLDFDGYADAVFAADLGGNVWKWLIHDAVLDPINGTGDLQHNSTDDYWPFFKIFTAGSCGTAESCTVPHYRSFFYPPTGALVDGTLWLRSGQRRAQQPAVRRDAGGREEPLLRVPGQGSVRAGASGRDDGLALHGRQPLDGLRQRDVALRGLQSAAVAGGGLLSRRRPGREVRHRQHDLLRGGADQLLQADDVLGSV